MFKKPFNLIRVVMLLSNPYCPDDRVRNEALALKNNGYEVYILAWDREGTRPARSTDDGLNLIRIKVPAGYEQGFKQGSSFFRVWLRFVQELRYLKPLIVHCHDFDTYFAGLIYWFYDRDVKLVLDTHENYSLMIESSVSARLGRLVKLLEYAFTRFADLLIGPCSATVNYYASLGSKKVVVIGNWKDPKNYYFEKEFLEKRRKELNIGNRLVVTYIGALSSERYVLPLIEAIAERQNFFLILGGSGIQEGAIRAAIANNDNVYFPGYIHPNDVPLYTAISDIIYYGHQIDHPYGPFNAPNKLYEALAAGKAILASDIGGELSSVVKSVNCGLLLSELTSKFIGYAIDILASDTVRIPMQERALQAGLQVYNQEIAQQRLLDAYADLGLLAKA
jgi:glycosyltransferase involved in cell wall biosynthesis